MIYIYIGYLKLSKIKLNKFNLKKVKNKRKNSFLKKGIRIIFFTKNKLFLGFGFPIVSYDYQNQRNKYENDAYPIIFRADLFFNLFELICIE